MSDQAVKPPRKRKRDRVYTIDPRRAPRKHFLPVYTDPEAEALPQMPKTWGECLAVGRGTKELPCTFFRCKHNLAIGVRIGAKNHTSISVINPTTDADLLPGEELDPSIPNLDKFKYTCVLQFVHNEPQDPSYPVIAEQLGCTQQRIQAIVVAAALKIQRRMD